jgi:hypothetical protein
MTKADLVRLGARTSDRGRLREVAGEERCAQVVREGRARFDPRRCESRLRPRMASADRGNGRGAPLRPGRFAGRDRAGDRRLDGGVGLMGADQSTDDRYTFPCKHGSRPKARIPHGDISVTAALESTRS